MPWSYTRQKLIKTVYVLAISALLAVLFSVSAFAVTSVPTRMNFQGKITDGSGAILPNGTYNMRFRLFDAPRGGTQQWSESRLVSATQGVTVTNGVFSVQLGEITSLPASVFNQTNLYFEVELPTPATATTSSPAWTEGAMSPRNKLATSAYAYNAEALDGLDSAQFARTDANNSLTGTQTVNNSSTAAFDIQNGSAVSVFKVNTSASQVTIGTSDTTGTVLVLDTKTNAGDPTGIAGAMYYNSNTAKFRCYQNGAWTDCVSAGGGGGDVYLANNQTFTGSNTFSTTSDTAFTIQNTSSTKLLAADTSNLRVSVGSATIVDTQPSSDTKLFNSKISYSPVPGSLPYSVTSADINGDGKLDVVTPSSYYSTISVYMNNGDGTLATKVDYSTGSNTSPRSISVADYNGDGSPDMSVANFNSNNISVFLNNGNGTFAAKVDYTGGSNPISVDSSDFNSDGKIDIVVANLNSNTVSVFMNNGNGTFATKVDYSTGNEPNSIKSADYNGDGKADLAFTSSYFNYVSVRLNNGDGTFANRVNYTTGTNPYSVTSADYNGDSKLDLIVANKDSNTISVLRNNGNGTFAAKVDYTTGTNPYSVTSADYNGDSKLDIAVANSGTSTVSVFINSGNGTFASKLDFTSSGSTYAITSADFNSDGKSDIGAAGINLDIFINANVLGSRVVTESANAKLQISADASEGGITIQAANSQSASLLKAQTYNGIQLMNLSSSGKLSLGNDTILLSGSSASATSKVDYTTGFGARGISSGDLNADGKSDTVVANYTSNTISVFLNNGNGTFATKVDYGTGSAPYSVSMADVNADGYEDLISTNNSSNTVSVLLNNGNGTFATKVDYVTGTNPSYSALADFNGDGKIDISASNLGSGTVSVLLNNGNGTFATKVDYTTGNWPNEVTTKDYNGDGKRDLATANYNSNTISVLLNNGNGTFATKVDYSTGANPNSLSSSDVNQDGKSDIIVANNNSNTVSVFINNGNGTFASKVDYATAVNPYSVTTADYNNDNKQDLIVANHGSNSVSVLLNNGNGTFATKVDYTTATQPYAVTTADYNNDGKPDITVSNIGSNSISVLLNNTVLSTQALLSLKTSNSSDGGLFVRGSSGQTASLFVIQDSDSRNIFNISPDNKISIGTSDTTGTLLVLDDKTDSGDPTGQNGAMYYNSNAGKFRCYEAGAWKDCDTGVNTANSYTFTAAQKVNVASTAAFDIQNGSAISVFKVNTSGNTVSVGTSDTTGTLFVLDDKTDSGDPTGQNGAMYYNSNAGKFRCYEAGAWKDCSSGGDAATLGGLASSAYAKTGSANTFTAAQTVNNTVTVNTSNTSAFDIQNGSAVSVFKVNTSGNTVSVGTVDATGTSFVLDTKNTSGDQTGVAGAMYYNSNAGKFRCYVVSAWTDCNSGGDAATLGGLASSAYAKTGSANTFTSTQTVNVLSASAFDIQNGSAVSVFKVDTSASTVSIGNGTNGATISINGGIILNGTARNTQTVTLVPEYPGATFTGDGTNNNGSLSSDFCSSSSILNTNTSACPLSADEHNYYAWTTTQGTVQDYDVFVRYRIPADYDTGSMTNLRIWGWGTTSASEIVRLDMYKGSSTACGTITNAVTANAAWNEGLAASPLGACTINAGDFVTFKVRVAAGQNNTARAGEITFTYRGKF